MALKSKFSKAAGRTRGPRRRESMGRTAPSIIVSSPHLTVLMAKSDGAYCAKCPELDLVTQLPTAEAALEDLLEAMREYAVEYLQERHRYQASPNRAHHRPYVEAIAACKTEWDLRALIEIRHGFIHV